MSGVSGIVKAVIGQVFAVSPDGSKRLLTEGDRILDGEQVQTGPTGAISLSLADGKQVDLGRDSHWDSSGHVATDATAAQQQDIAAIQQAIADAVARIRRAGKAAGILTPDEALARKYLELGCTFVAVGLDTQLLVRSTSALAARFKQTAAPAPQSQTY